MTFRQVIAAFVVETSLKVTDHRQQRFCNNCNITEKFTDPNNVRRGSPAGTVTPIKDQLLDHRAYPTLSSEFLLIP